MLGRCLPAVGTWYYSGPPAVRRQVGRVLSLLQRILAKILPLALTIGASVALAWGILNVSPQRVVAAILGSILLAIFARRLELGIIAVLTVAASIVYSSIVPKPITIGGQGPQVTELLIFFLLLVVFVRSCVERNFEFLKSRFTLPLLLLCMAVLLSMCVSHQMHMVRQEGSWPFHHIYNTARPTFHYLFFFPVAFGIQTERQLKLILRFMIWMAVVVSLLMVVQYFLGPRGKSVFIGTEYTPSFAMPFSWEETEVARSLPPGLSVILLLFLVTLLRAAYQGIRAGIVSAAAAATMGIGLIFSFTRNYWVSTLLALGIVWLAAGAVLKRRLLGAMLTIAIIAVVGSVSIRASCTRSSGAKVC